MDPIALAAQELAAGGLVAFPTETVYGLGADARSTTALAALYRAKGRPLTHPVIVHLAAGAAVSDWASVVPPVTQALIERFWPGPLTFILKRAPDVLDAVTGGQDTVGLRCPDHPMAQALLKAFSRLVPRAGVAAPSANRFGHVSPTTALHVRAEFGPDLTILDGGPTDVGIESTILDLSRLESAGPVLLRPGAIAPEDLAEVLGTLPGRPDRGAPRVAGALTRHYAPATPLKLVSASDLARVAKGVAIWSYSLAEPELARWGRLGRRAPSDPARYARELYATLRALDAARPKQIWVERPPETAAWAAVLDRLRRAAAGRGADGT